MQAADFFADELALQNAAAEMGKEVFTLQETASRCPAAHKSWLAEWKSLYDCEDVNMDNVREETTPADMVRCSFILQTHMIYHGLLFPQTPVSMPALIEACQYFKSVNYLSAFHVHL